jgi:phage shock protein C
METGGPVRRLQRSRSDRVIAGVCGGLGEYLGVDPILLRIAFVILGFTGFGVLIYLVGWVVMPESTSDTAATPPAGRAPSADAVRLIVGGLFIALGAMVLLDNVFDWFSDLMWPALLIAVGAAVIVYGAKR